jgi:hypothetical protein
MGGESGGEGFRGGGGGQSASLSRAVLVSPSLRREGMQFASFEIWEDAGRRS